jgi:hypothetical protein
VIKTLDKFSLFGPICHGGIPCRLQDQLGLLERMALTKVPQELKEPHVPRQVRFADAPKHPQVRLEQGEQTLRPILMHVTTGILLLRVIDERMHVAFQRLRAAGGIGLEPTARLHRHVGGLLHRLDGAIPGRLDDDCPLATDPRDDRGPVFVLMAPPGLTFLAAPTRAASPCLLPALLRLPLVTRGVVEVIRFNRAFELAMPLRRQRRMASPPTPPIAGPDMHAHLPRHAP